MTSALQLRKVGDVTARPSASASRRRIRASTLESRRLAVERVLATMRERYCEPLTLHELAGQAFLSPYHFNRVFRTMTGVPPGRFLAAMRMDEAKRLLLTTDLRVTDICLEVGYRSLGTFTTHFQQLVGVSPSRLRRLAVLYGSVPIASLAEPATLRPVSDDAEVFVRVLARDGFEGTAFLGLFPTPLPQTRPSACAVVTVPASARLTCTQHHAWYPLASAFSSSLTIRDALFADEEETRVAVSPAPIEVDGGPHKATVDLTLRRLGALDPPILLALPLVLAEAALARPAAGERLARLAAS